MIKVAYYPQWYIRKLSKNNSKSSKRIVILFLIFSLIISKEILEVSERIKSLKSEIQSSNINNTRLYSVQKTSYEYNYIYNVFKEKDIEICTLNINSDDISIEINVSDNNDYREKINLLERNFEIIEVSSIIERDENQYFKVRVRINDI